MKKRLAGLLGTALLMTALVAFTGSALAGNGNGNGNGAGGGSATPPGNSANAPGQVKKSSPTPSTSSSGNSGHMQNAPTQPGVKPSNSTQKNTVAPATSNKTKLYGNGKTAGQIAQSHGYTGNLYGPGNSQPHKVTDCRGRSVDVHALKSKSHAATNCATTTSTSVKKTTTPTTAPALSIVIPSLGQVSPVVVGGILGALASSRSPNGGVLGAVAGARAHGGVLGAVAAARRHGKLPFTGFPVWIALLIGFSLTAAGLGLRRSARATI
jgi:hypothetical protein